MFEEISGECNWDMCDWIGNVAGCNHVGNSVEFRSILI